jgi:hypothetical protein
MTTDATSAYQYVSWQFSLKGLMFVTTIVAICAALFGVSMLLAAILVPLIVAGFMRTIRVATQHETTGCTKPGLFVTFCNSVALVVATIAVGLATMAVAAVAGTLAAIMVTAHVLRAARPIYWPLTRVLLALLIRARNTAIRMMSRIQPVAVLRWLQVHAVAKTLSLLATNRRLFQQCWYGTTS